MSTKKVNEADLLKKFKEALLLRKVKDVHPNCKQEHREHFAYREAGLAIVILEDGKVVKYVTATDWQFLHFVFFNPKTGQQEHPLWATSILFQNL